MKFKKQKERNSNKKTNQISRQNLLKMNPYIIFIYALLNIISLSKCNIWDNFFSQLKSPHYRIPDEFSLMLFKDSLNIMNISASYKYNSYKLSLFQNPFNVVKNDLKFLEDKTNNNIFNETIVDIYVNFTGGIVNLDFHDSCKYINATALSKFSSKFFLESYELLTLFEQEDVFYDYILMNPLNNHILDSTIKNLQENKNMFLSLNTENSRQKRFGELKESNSVLAQLIEILKQLGVFDLTDKSLLKYNKDYQVYFKVDKKEESLKLISFIYKGINLVNLDVKVLLEQKEEGFFKPQSTNCTILTPNTTAY